MKKLILDACPGGVLFSPLGELCSIKTGPNINKNLIGDNPGPYPVINSGKEPLGFYGEYNVEDDPIGIASRGSVGLVSWTEGRYFRGNLNYSCSVLDRHQLDRRYLFHFLLHADSQIQALATHQGIPALNASRLKTLKVPVPPLAIQKQIAVMIDGLVKTKMVLEAELAAEIDARNVQFEFFRGQFFEFSELESHVL